jgi:hypothetical protein
MGFHKYATDFLDAAVLPTAATGYTPVPYYCACRALELGLKSFLLCHDVPIETLKGRDYGHNLEALLGLARVKGITALWTPTVEDVTQMRMANAYYAGKGFEYFEGDRAVTGYTDLPDLGLLRTAAAALLNSIRELTRDVS